MAERPPAPIPVSVIVTTKNEAGNIERCLRALSGFAEVIVVDSESTDDTKALSLANGARVFDYRWDGRYPKKRQWCLECIETVSPWVFFVDADEEVTEALRDELARIFSGDGPKNCAGYFVRGRYVWAGRILKHGLMNDKLALVHRERLCFPVVDDLDISGMGEIEGHYQPVLKEARAGFSIGRVRAPLLHHAYEDGARWTERHARYARWEAAMTRRGAWPRDPVAWRDRVKRVLRRSRLRPLIVFVYGYFFGLGFLDGRAGWSFALSRARYAQAVVAETRRAFDER